MKLQLQQQATSIFRRSPRIQTPLIKELCHQFSYYMTEELDVALVVMLKRIDLEYEPEGMIEDKLKIGVNK